MTTPDQVADLIQRMGAGDGSVAEALRALSTRCVHDRELVTPFAVAIRHDHREALAVLLEDDEAIEYCPSLDEAVASHAKMMASNGVGKTTEATERYLVDHQVVPFPYWQRTPLLEACRWGNTNAIAALVARGASLSAEDLLGLDAVDLCLDSEDDALLETLIESCVESGRACPVEGPQLERAARRPRAWELMVRHGKLAAPAKRLAFNVACARLDLETVEGMISSGFKPAAAVSTERHPAVEAATSHLAWSLGLPEFAVLAAGFAHLYGHPDSASIGSADLFDDDGNPISFAKANALRLRRNAALRRKESNPTFVPDEQLGTRLALLDVLSEHGLGPGKYRGAVVSNVIATNRPELLDRMRDFGFETGPAAGEDGIKWAMLNGFYSVVEALYAHGHSTRGSGGQQQEAAAYTRWLETRIAPEGRPTRDAEPIATAEPSPPELLWELAGESVLRARLDEAPVAGTPCRVRLELGNVYGPHDGIELFVRVGSPDSPTPVDGFRTVDWTPATLVEETLLIDDDEVARDAVDAPLMTETPWRAVHEAMLTLPAGRATLEVAVVSSLDPEMNGVLTGWVIQSSDPT